MHRLPCHACKRDSLPAARKNCQGNSHAFARLGVAHCVDFIQNFLMLLLTLELLGHADAGRLLLHDAKFVMVKISSRRFVLPMGNPIREKGAYGSFSNEPSIRYVARSWQGSRAATCV
jgi:hypothetical protein